MKKLTALMLSSAMMLSLAACGGSASTETVSSEAASSEAASSEAASSEAASTEEAASAHAAAVTTVNAGKLTMSTNAAFPPYEMTTDSGDFEGIDIEVAGAIAEKLGLELQVDDMDFDAALLAAQNGKSDMVMAGVTVTDERLKVMDFSDTYAEGIQSIIVPEDSDIATADDLSGKAIGTQRGTTGYLYCTDDFGEENVIAYDDGLTAVQALNNGQVDAVVIDNAPAQEFVAANPGLKILDTAYAQEDYAIGVAKGNTQLLDAINGALEELQADGTLQAIVDKYITAE
ncbi:transporter substrate-binding domain-containing protein [Gemmiger sp.]